MTVKTALRAKKAAAPRPARKPADTYLDRVKRFPLTRVRSRAHLAAAVRVLDRLLREDLDRGGREYLDALTTLVEAYESGRVAIPDASEADVLRELMRANGLTQPKLAGQVGVSQSTVSAVLNGTRSLTKGQIVALAKFFGVSPAAFLPA